MTKLLTLLAFSVLVAISEKSYGQQDLRVKEMALKLNIPDSSAAKTWSIIDEYKSNAKKVMRNDQLNDQQKRATIDSLIDNKNEKISKILTQEQLKTIISVTEFKKREIKLQKP